MSRTGGRFASVRQRLQQRPPDQELFPEQLAGGLVTVDDAGRFHQPDFEELARVVPLVDGLADVEPLVALQPDQVGPEPGGEHLGDLCLADTRFTLEEKRTLQREGEVNGGGQAPVSDVELTREQRLELLDGRDGCGRTPYLARSAAAVSARLTHTGTTAFRYSADA